MTDDNAFDAAIRFAFMERYQSDREDGAVLSEDAYVALYPDHPELIRETLRELTVEPEEFEAPGESLDLSTTPRRIGRYTIIRRIGYGGMGAVFKAEQDDPRRTVALKMLRAPFPSAEVIRRFHREAAALGQLKHRGIAQIYEAATLATADGPIPYYTMELVDGAPLDRYAKERALEIHEKAGLMASVADAVQHAHDHEIIHRDLKPANILVDRNGQPKVLDFGVARLAGEHPHLTSLHTVTGQIMGTIPYMSPEQVGGTSAAIDGRSDVYSLGVILHELLAGRLPYDVAARSLPDAARVIQDHEPTKLGSIDEALRGDLEVIVLQALAKEPARRYASASDLAADLRGFVDGRPIRARPLTTFHYAIRFVRRHRALVGAVVVAFVSLVVALLVSLSQTRIARTAKDEAVAARWTAEREAYRARIGAAATAIEVGDPLTAFGQLDPIAASSRGWEWHHLASRLDESVSRWRANAIAVALTPRGLSALDDSGALLERPLAGGPVERSWSIETAGAVGGSSEAGAVILAAAFSGDGSRVAVMQGEAPTIVTLWDVPARERVGSQEITEEAPEALFLSERGDQVAWPGRQRAYVWDLRVDPSVVRALPLRGSNRSLPMAIQGSRLFFGGRYGGLGLKDLNDDAVRANWKTGSAVRATAIAVSPDGRRIALATVDKRVRVLDIESGLWIAEFLGHQKPAISLAFGPDSTTLASAGPDRTIRVWDVEDRSIRRILTGHRSDVHQILVSPDGGQLASLSANGAIRTWDLSSDPNVFRGHASFVYAVSFCSDGETIASGAWDDTVRFWDLATGTERARSTFRSNLSDVKFSRNGDRLVAAHSNPSVTLLNPADGQVIARFPVGSGRARTTCWLGDDRLLVAMFGGAVERGVIRLLDTTGGELLAELDGHDGTVRSIAASPGATHFATASSDGTIRLWDATTLKPVKTFVGHEGTVYDVAFDHSGDRLASGSEDMTARVWDVETGETLHVLSGHEGAVRAVAFTPDGQRVATGGHDAIILIHDAESGQWVLRLRGHDDYVHSIAFSPDGTVLASGSGDGTVRMWHTRPRHARGRSGAALGAASPDERPSGG